MKSLHAMSSLISTLFQCMFLIVAPCLLGQDDVSRIARALHDNSNNSFSKFSASFDVNGNLKFYHTERPGLSSAGSLPFLESDSLLEELELSFTQTSKFKEIVSAWKRKHDLLKDKFYDALKTNTVDDSGFKRLATDLNNCHSEGWKELEQLLLPHQLAAMSQIQLRFYLRSHGLIEFLQLPEVGDFANIRPADINKIRNFVFQKKSKLARQVIDSRLNALDNVLTLFDEQEREVIRKKWPYLESEEADYAEQFRIHLDLSEKFDEKSKGATVFQHLAGFPRFEMSVSGVFEPVNPANEADEVSFVSLFVQLFREAGLTLHLDLTEQQAQAIDLVIHDYSSTMQVEITKNFRRSIESTPRLDEPKSDLGEIQLTEARKAKRAIELLLTETQLGGYRRIAEALLERRLGPFWDMMYGSLSEELGITDMTRKSLENSINEVKKSFGKQLSELEREWLEEVFEVLDEPKRERVSKLLGAGLMHNPPNMSVYLSGR
jgi:hypothetical protein